MDTELAPIDVVPTRPSTGAKNATPTPRWAYSMMPRTDSRTPGNRSMAVS